MFTFFELAFTAILGKNGMDNLSICKYFILGIIIYKQVSNAGNVNGMLKNCTISNKKRCYYLGTPKSL